MTTAPGADAIQPDGAELTTDDERQRYAAISRALADAKRLCVLECLSKGERSVSDLSREASCQVPNMSQHLAVLRAAGLVESRREGNIAFATPHPHPLIHTQLLAESAKPATSLFHG